MLGQPESWSGGQPPVAEPRPRALGCDAASQRMVGVASYASIIELDMVGVSSGGSA